MLPMVAATISRRIEGCFGNIPVCNLSAVMLGLPNVVQAQPVHRFIASPSRGSSRQPQILGGRGQLHPFQIISKEKSGAPRSPPERQSSWATWWNGRPRRTESRRTLWFHALITKNLGLKEDAKVLVEEHVG